MSNPGRAEVQIWAAGTGGGHLSVAQALVAALAARTSGQVSVALDDPTQDPIGRTARTLARAYGPLVRTSPALWGVLFHGFSSRGLSSGMDRFLLRQLGPAMAERTRLRSPRVIVNCHPLLGPPARLAADAAAANGDSPAWVTVMTDLVGGHPGWLSPRPDAILTATPQATDWCRHHGVPEHLIRQTGLPIDPELAGGPLLPGDRRQLRQTLGLDPHALGVLVGGGAEGVGSLRRLAQCLGESGLPLQVVVACGNNRRLRNWLLRHPPGVATIALDHQASLTPWLRAADVYLGKAGPSTLAEAAAAGLALLVTEALPGQEENNGRTLAAAGAALQVRSRDELLVTLARLCRAEDPLLAELQRGARAWARPAAASEAAEIVLSFLGPDRGVPASPPRARSAAG
ncbi:MAG TPA: glycosyltransferase [Candidatus Dormibacteraeota bacterium]|nr:glycosyltransferase [Candidatus Dormibacteraeota bacterium]